MRWAAMTIGLAVAALSHSAMVAAQSLPPGGYYADGAYYLPGDRPVSAAAPASQGQSACPLGYGVPTVYVASTPTMVRIQWVWPSGGGSAPGFPYLPVYTLPAEC
jgi:hypothetical protein